MQKKRGSGGFDALRFIKIVGSIIGLLISAMFLVFVGFVFMGFISLFLAEDTTLALGGNVALIPIKGTISTSDSSSYFQTGGIKSQKIVDWIKEAEKDEKIKAIVFDIDSPGGTPVGTAEIADAIGKAKKPTVAVIHELGASGAYWVASAADVIFANRMSTVGSIGVRGSYLEYAGLMAKYNVTYRRLVAGKYKDITSAYKEMTPEEQALVQSKLDKLHNIFIREVAQNRNLSIEKVSELATGYIYLGEEAKELGLVDMLGGNDEAKEYLEKMLNITVTFKEFKAKKGLLEAFSQTAYGAAYTIGEGMGSVLFGSTKDDLEFSV
ncbi:MAG: signal peptide peptidase SppA [Candidatus Woesearchaeota archaeon]